MKKMYFFLLMVFLSTATYSQTESNTVMIKSIETYGSFVAMKSSLHILDENGNLTTTDLVNHNTKGIPTNMVAIKSALDEYLNIGYELISSNALSFGWNGVFTIEHTFILEKKKNED